MKIVIALLVTMMSTYPAYATVSCTTGANGYTYCVDSKTGKAFIIKPQPGGGFSGGGT